MVDIATFGETMLRLSPQHGNRLETAPQLSVRTTGSESNVAVAASRLGLDAAWLSAVPDSPLGRRVVDDLRTHGVRTAVSWTADGHQPTQFVEEGNAPRARTVLTNREGAPMATVRPDDLDLTLVEDAALFYTSGVTAALSETTRETTATVLATAAEAETRTVLGVTHRPELRSVEEARADYEALVEHVDVLVVTARDAQVLFDYDGDATEVAHGVRSQFDVETVLLLRGDQGALVSHRKQIYEQPAFETAHSRPGGSDDAFVGGFLTRWLADEDVGAALTYGAATAALTRSLPGDLGIVTPAEVEAVVSDSDDGQ
ncbi:sugar kinase [Halomarina rubra]|uniref:Sugar kinase n=1 Tax=Halomarina rubra TaxID=2071873 RepID=A0ABD6AR28_9EURY|nr:sugar kinase [Halomarina rubra]